MSQKIVRWCLLIFLITDIGYSFLQHKSMPLDGDMAGGFVPDEHVKRVLEDPFALSVLKDDATYANPNRFFAHWTYLHYFKSAPLALQHVTDPINSIYVACAIAKTLIQVLVIFLLAAYISGTTVFWKTEFLIPAALITPLIQVNGFVGCMGIIDPSITYTFFYALPLALAMLFFLPHFLQLHHSKNGPGIPGKLMLVALAVFISLNGALVPSVLIITATLYLTYKLFDKTSAIRLRSFVTFLFALGAVLGAYSLYVGANNVLLTVEHMEVVERYKRLPIGLWKIFSNKLGLPILLLIIVANVLLIKKHFMNEEGKKILRLAMFIGIGAVIYLVLLPLGGYRTYRPDIIRYDTLMPVTIGLMLLYGISSVFVLRNTTRKWYVGTLLAISVIFMLADAPEFAKNSEERSSFSEIAASPDSIVEVDRNCTILSWTPINDPNQSRLNGEALYYWGVTDKPKRYFHAKGENP